MLTLLRISGEIHGREYKRRPGLVLGQWELPRFYPFHILFLSPSTLNKRETLLLRCIEDDKAFGTGGGTSLPHNQRAINKTARRRSHLCLLFHPSIIKLSPKFSREFPSVVARREFGSVIQLIAPTSRRWRGTPLGFHIIIFT